MEKANVSCAANDSCQQIEHLIQAARGGCKESLEQLITASRNYLCTIANQELPREVHSKVAPSDLVQESLFEAHRDFSGFKGNHQQELFAWLRRILLHNLANARRTYQSTLKRAIGREVALDGFDVATGRPIALPQIQSSPSSMVGLQEQVQLLHAAVDRLPEDYKQVILLRHRDHLPFEAIAKQLNRSAAAARKLWSRAIECLQQELTATDDDFRNK